MIDLLDESLDVVAVGRAIGIPSSLGKENQSELKESAWYYKLSIITAATSTHAHLCSNTMILKLYE